MSDAMVMEYDGKQVSLNLKKMAFAFDNGADKANLDVAFEVMRLSQKEVPHDEGTLQNSGTVESLPNGDVVVGYHTRYAARLHEHPEYNFQRGRKGKYLSDPILRNETILGLKYVRNITTHLGRSGLRSF